MFSGVVDITTSGGGDVEGDVVVPPAAALLRLLRLNMNSPLASDRSPSNGWGDECLGLSIRAEFRGESNILSNLARLSAAAAAALLVLEPILLRRGEWFKCDSLDALTGRG